MEMDVLLSSGANVAILAFLWRLDRRIAIIETVCKIGGKYGQ